MKDTIITNKQHDAIILALRDYCDGLIDTKSGPPVVAFAVRVFYYYSNFTAKELEERQ